MDLHELLHTLYEEDLSPKGEQLVKALHEMLEEQGVLKEGRVLSQKNEEILRSVGDALADASQKLQSVLEQVQPRSETAKAAPVLKTSEDGTYTLWCPIKKVDSYRRVVTSLALVANTVDLQDDFVRPEEIWKAMENYMLAFQEVGIMHQEINPLLKVVECYQAPASFELGDQTVQVGDWVMSVKVLDDEVWKQVEEGVLRGFSIEGRAQRVKVALPEDVAPRAA